MRDKFQQIRMTSLVWAVRCIVLVIALAYYTYAGAVDTQACVQTRIVRPGCVERLNLEVIKIIESGGDPKAFNSRTKCYGLYQISKICLLDYNQFNKTNYNPEDLFNPLINKKIATWYFNRIRQMLVFYHVPVTTSTLVASYNWGIGNVVKWHRADLRFKDLPKVTRKYIAKYRELTRRAN